MWETSSADESRVLKMSQPRQGPMGSGLKLKARKPAANGWSGKKQTLMILESLLISDISYTLNELTGINASIERETVTAPEFGAVMIWC